MVSYSWKAYDFECNTQPLFAGYQYPLIYCLSPQRLRVQQWKVVLLDRPKEDSLPKPTRNIESTAGRLVNSALNPTELLYSRETIGE